MPRSRRIYYIRCQLFILLSIGFGQSLVEGLCSRVGTQDVKDVQVNPSLSCAMYVVV